MSYGHLDLLSIYIHLVNKESLTQFYFPSPFTPNSVISQCRESGNLIADFYLYPNFDIVHQQLYKLWF